MKNTTSREILCNWAIALFITITLYIFSITEVHPQDDTTIIVIPDDDAGGNGTTVLTCWEMGGMTFCE